MVVDIWFVFGPNTCNGFLVVWGHGLLAFEGRCDHTFVLFCCLKSGFELSSYCAQAIHNFGTCGNRHTNNFAYVCLHGAVIRFDLLCSHPFSQHSQ